MAVTTIFLLFNTHTNNFSWFEAQKYCFLRGNNTSLTLFLSFEAVTEMEDIVNTQSEPLHLHDPDTGDDKRIVCSQ